MAVTKRRWSTATAFERITPATLAYAAACVLPVIMVFIIKIFTLPVPFMDEWAWATLVYRLHVGTLRFADLWQQHNEHRMFVPNLIALGLAALGGWNQFRETLFSLLLVLLTQIGVFVLLRRIVSRGRLPYVFLVASLLLYSLAQMENWDWGFQIAWFLCNACVVWALVLLGTAGQSWFASITAILIATVGSYSSSQGLMIWPAGLAALLLAQKRRPAQIFVWIGVAVVVFVGYFSGYEKPNAHPPLMTALQHPFTAARYVGAYVGSLFGSWQSFGLCVLVGWLGIGGLAYFVSRVILEHRVDRLRSSRAAGWVGLACYTLSCAVITAVGRVGFGEMQAEASRYTSIAIYGWIALVALGAAYLPSLQGSRRLRSGLLGAALAFALLYLGSERAALEMGWGRVTAVRAALPAMIAGSGSQLTALFPSEAFVQLMLKQLKSVKDGPYYE